MMVQAKSRFVIETAPVQVTGPGFLLIEAVLG